MRLADFHPDRCRSRAPRMDLPVALALIALTSLVGCRGEQWQAETYPASGQITINGEPPAGAVVTLHPIAGNVDQRGSSPWGIVQPDGSFLLSTYEKGDGAPVGDYAITVRWPLDVTDMSAAMTDRLGGAYSTQQRSPLTVTIAETENELPPVHLDRAKVLSEKETKSPRRAPPGPNMNSK